VDAALADPFVGSSRYGARAISQHGLDGIDHLCSLA
jgi:hypothetical protein